MKKFPEGSEFSLRATRELSERDLRRLAVMAARMGFEPLFSTSPIPLDPEEMLRYYVATTYPSTPKSYLGREHFRVIGDDLELPRRHMGRIFTHLCYPLKCGFLVDPLRVGLVVTTREAALMPPLEGVNLNSPEPSRRQKKHERHFRDLPPQHETVIQAKGIIDLSRNQSRAGELGILGTYSTFRQFGEGLAEIVGYPEDPAS